MKGLEGMDCELAIRFPGFSELFDERREEENGNSL
jgi:hypothetical protein